MSGRIPGLAGSLTIRLELDDELCKGYSAAEREFLGRPFELVQCAHGVRWGCYSYSSPEQLLFALNDGVKYHRAVAAYALHMKFWDISVHAERASFLEICAGIIEDHAARLWPAL